VVPGGLRNGQPRSFVRRYAARVPLARMARHEDVIGVVQLLAGGASAYVTGQPIAVDGGLTAW
jgi:NAD(P)-dependent dehydrogenase (short-subunit alcohol dehydrogenase family)